VRTGGHVYAAPQKTNLGSAVSKVKLALVRSIARSRDRRVSGNASPHRALRGHGSYRAAIATAELHCYRLAAHNAMLSRPSST
jgi:hypothetical protein